MWILNYLDFLPLFLIISVFSLLIKASEAKQHFKTILYSICSIICLLSVQFLLSTFSTFENRRFIITGSHKVYVKQVDIDYSKKKYMVLTNEGQFKEFSPHNTKVIFSNNNKPYVQIDEVKYVTFWGKLANSQFEGSGYTHKYVYSLVVPENSYIKNIK